VLGYFRGEERRLRINRWWWNVWVPLLQQQQLYLLSLSSLLLPRKPFTFVYPPPSVRILFSLSIDLLLIWSLIIMIIFISGDDGNIDSESQSKSSSNELNFNLSPITTNRCFSISPLSNVCISSIYLFIYFWLWNSFNSDQNLWGQDAAMGLVLSAATGRGWTTGSGMEGPPVPAVGKDGQSGTENISTFPWSLFTKSPRRRMLIAFTCTICGQRTTRAINPHAYTDGTVFVQVTMPLLLLFETNIQS